MDQRDARKKHVIRSKWPSRADLYDRDRKLIDNRSSSTETDRRVPGDRKVLDRKVNGPRAADKDRSASRASHWERTAGQKWTREEDRSRYQDRRHEEGRRDVERRSHYQDRRDEEGRWDVDGGRSEDGPGGRGVHLDREPGVPGSPPTRSVEGSPPFRHMAQHRGVNWVPSTRGEFPFIVRLSAYYVKDGAWFYEPCGASVISHEFLLTAAHCFDHHRAAYGQMEPSRIYAYLNEFDTTQPDESAIVTAAQVILHSHYSNLDASARPLNDVAVVKLSSPLNFAELGVGSICLDASHIGSGIAMTIAGWGKKAEGDTHMNTQLYKSTSEVTLSNAQCIQDTNYSENDIGSDAICASGTGAEGLEDACQGDSGGPMFHKKNGKFAQTGVVSWGRGCARKDYPGVYARLSMFADWVVGVTSQAAIKC